jgi:SPP1 family phage portal protein
MNKVNEFEYGDVGASRRYTHGFPPESNIMYRAESAEELLNNPDKIVRLINHHHEKQCPRLAILDDYIKAKNTGIYHDDSRRVEKEKSDHRAAHNFAKIINTFDVGYNTGIPIKKNSDDDAINEIISTYDAENDIEALDSELWWDMREYGRAYELQYRNRWDEDKSVISNVFETFVVYGLDAERMPLLAVRYPKHWDDYREYAKVSVYTDTHIYNYKTCTLPVNRLILESEEEHFWGEVPVTEYSPNRYRQSAFEDVLPLIDLYDSAQSDTANYMTDLNEATLVISGDLDLMKYTVSEMAEMKKSNMLLLANGVNPDGSKSQTDAKYVYKQYDATGTEAYKNRLQSDIHKISFVPDLTDEAFSGTQSGEAMKYKLFGFQQQAKTSQRGFKKGLMRRYRLLLNMKNYANEATNASLDSFTVMFTPNLPKAVLDELKTLVASGTEFSQETMLGLASFVEDIQLELDRIKEEQQNSVITSLYDRNGGASGGDNNDGE